MKPIRPSYNTQLLAINRAYFEADHGRTSLALERLKALAGEFPDDPHILYAYGHIRRDYVGQGVVSRQLFEKAFNSASNNNTANTRWLALCNWAGLAANKEELRHLVELALKEHRKDNSDFQHFCSVLKLLDAGAAYEEILLEEALVDIKAQNYGAAASLLEIALAAQPGSKIELSLRHQRALSLRALDAGAERIRSANTEWFAPEERLALQEAVKEMTGCISLDGYDPTFWNYKAGWCVLLSRYEEAVKCADAAIKLRPFNYPRPYINKAQALEGLGREKDALACANEAVEQAQTGGDSPADLEQAKELVVACSQSRTAPTLDNLEPLIQHIVNATFRTSEEEFGQTGPRVLKTTLDKVVQRLTGQILLLQHSPFSQYVPIMVELLSDFTPETAFCASLKIAQHNKSWVEYLLTPSLYISANSQGVLRRDAARYFCLMTLFFVDGAAVRAYYRQAILEPSAAASNEMKNLDNIMRAEMARMNPFFPHLIADQEPVDVAGRARAIRNVLSHFID